MNLTISEARKIITDKPIKNEKKILLKNGSFAWLHIKKSGCTIRLSEEDEAWILDKITEELPE